MRSSRALLRLAIPAASSLLAFHSPAQCDVKGPTHEMPSFEERVVGNYENRIRRFSAPERVFEYFSSIELDGEFYMTREDLARALTPYTYRRGAPLSSKNAKYNFQALKDKPSKETVQEYKKKIQTVFYSEQASSSDMQDLLAFREAKFIDDNTHLNALRELELTHADYEKCLEYYNLPLPRKTFFELVDADGDGLISYPEYLFFNTILAIPERQFEVAFKMLDSDGNGKLDRREFKQILHLLRQQTPAGKQNRALTDGDSIPIFKHLFGKLGTESLTFSEFQAFRRELREEIMLLQFEQFDADASKELSPREFGMYLISYVDPSEMTSWVKRLDILDDMEGSISLKEFMHFSYFLDCLDEIKVAMDLVVQGKGLNKEQFQRAVKAALRGGESANSVTPIQIDILFRLFDTDGDGHLSAEEFLHVMKKRQDNGFNERRDMGVLDFMTKIYNCGKDCI